MRALNVLIRSYKDTINRQQSEIEALRSDVNFLRAQLGQTNIDFPNSKKGGYDSNSGTVDVNKILFH